MSTISTECRFCTVPTENSTGVCSFCAAPPHPVDSDAVTVGAGIAESDLDRLTDATRPPAEEGVAALLASAGADAQIGVLVARPSSRADHSPERWCAMTVSPEVTRWITVQDAEGKARRTVQERATTMARFERDLGRPAITATADEVAKWVGRDRHRRSAITIACDLSKLRAFYRWALLTGTRADDPTAVIKAPRRPRRQPRPITDAQFWRLVDSAPGLELQAMVLLAGIAGLRVHEVAKFHGRDLDHDARTLTVTGKGGHRHTVPVHDDILAVARQMPAAGYWFPTQRRDRKHLGGREVSLRLRLHMIACRVPGTPHALRHYFCTELVERGADIRVVQELARHAQLSTTAVYVAASKARQRTAVESLGRTDGGR